MSKTAHVDNKGVIIVVKTPRDIERYVKFSLLPVTQAYIYIFMVAALNFIMEKKNLNLAVIK